MKTYILSVPIDCVTRKEALDKLLSFLTQDRNHMVITPNPEMVMAAQTDNSFMHIMKKADLVIPDGIGIVLASRLEKNSIKERVAGCDLFEALFDEIKGGPHTIYFLGAKPGVAESARKNMTAKYPGLKIIGVHDGFFDEDEEKKIIADIQEKKPDILLVALGFPKQEKWMYRHREELPVRISAGVGGSLDVMGGAVKRAPAFFRRFGLEWFYRLISEPSRIGRMAVLPRFAIRVIKNRNHTRKD